MKKALSLLFAVLLMVSVVPFASADVSASPVNFGDFSMAIDPSMTIEYADRLDGQIWFTLYPAYNIDMDERTNFNVVWHNFEMDVSTLMDDGGQEIIDVLYTNIATGLAAEGITLNSCTVTDIELKTLDGLQDVAIFQIVEISAYGITLTAYQLWAVVSGSFGTYEFTGTAFNMDRMEQYIYPLFGAITWND